MADETVSVRSKPVTPVRTPAGPNVTAGVARTQFAAAVDGLLKDRRFDPELTVLPELEMLEASTALALKR